MKRIGSIILAAVLLLTLMGCTRSAAADGSLQADEPQPSPAAAPVGEEDAPAEANQKSDVLVVYFSRTGEQYNVGVIEEGNTAIVARMIAAETGADLFEILPTDDHYPLTYNELTDVAKREQRENARPGYAGQVPDLAPYTAIFIGAPVWWGDWPMILYTFFETNGDALAGKTLIPFSTHEGSGLSGFDKKLSAACPNSTVLQGLAIRGADAQNDRDGVQEKVKAWLSALEY